MFQDLALSRIVLAAASVLLVQRRFYFAVARFATEILMSTSSSLTIASSCAVRTCFVSNRLRIMRHACRSLGVLMWFMLLFFHVKASPWPETEPRSVEGPCSEHPHLPRTLTMAQTGSNLDIITSTSNIDMQSSPSSNGVSVATHDQVASSSSHAMNGEKLDNIVEMKDVVSEKDQTCKIETTTPYFLKRSHGHGYQYVDTGGSPLETALLKTPKLSNTGKLSFKHHSGPASLVADDQQEQAVEGSQYFGEEADINVAIQLYHRPSTTTDEDAGEFESELRKRRNPSESGSVPGAPSLGHNSIPDSVNSEESLHSPVESSTGFCYLSGASTTFQGHVQSEMDRLEFVEEGLESDKVSIRGISSDATEHVQVLAAKGSPGGGFASLDAKQLKNNLAKSSIAPISGSPSTGRNGVSSE